MSAPDDDPIRANRSRIAKWSLLANRIGWLLYALAMSSFVMAFVLGFSGPLVTVVVVSLIGLFPLKNDGGMRMTRAQDHARTSGQR